MTGKEITDKLKELNQVEELTCTESELKEYELCGLIMQIKDNTYVTRNGKNLKLDIIKSKNYKFNLDFSNIIVECNNIVKDDSIKKVYYICKKTYDKFITQQRIIKKNNIDYYRFYDNDLWRVVIK